MGKNQIAGHFADKIGFFAKSKHFRVSYDYVLLHDKLNMIVTIAVILLRSNCF
jgi:hypothetical protein